MYSESVGIETAPVRLSLIRRFYVISDVFLPAS